MSSFFLTFNKLIGCISKISSLPLLHDTLSNRHQETVSSLSLYFLLLCNLSPKRIKTYHAFSDSSLSNHGQNICLTETIFEIAFVNSRHKICISKNSQPPSHQERKCRKIESVISTY